ncbi:pentatricopeptide repeat-containing protein At4g36680, mitochondrial-like [Lolium rigidum]|uniref:pentatricopeptide repeat-containing protein At4g36680, mitochondrial-like n=1 Tax=Lolium rigidum TaxID=89674 RepID=UPI001F5D9449|nr:pentatricopeptide repeat-containing protein At4g36680, mitochondrial-like [Lolium rigidum]
MAAFFSASGRRLLSTAAAVSEYAVPIARIRNLARAGRLTDIDATVAPLIQAHPKAVISALSLVGLSDQASAILSTISSPTSELLNALLGPLLRRRRHAERVPGLLNAHPSAPRNAVTWSILAKSLCITKGADEAVYLLHGEEPPSLHLYTAIIDSYYKEKKPHRAEELWRDMVDKHGIAPDAAAYNVRITYKSTAGTVEEVKELIRAMHEEAGIQPDAVSYNGLIRVLGRHKRVDEALEVYRGFQEKVGAEGNTEAKSTPDCSTYTAMARALCNAERWSEAEDVFYDGVKRRKVVELGTVRKLVVGLNKAGKGRAARRVVVGLRKKFPDHFNGPWQELEKDAGLTPGASNEEEDAEEDEQQPAKTAATA